MLWFGKFVNQCSNFFFYLVCGGLNMIYFVLIILEYFLEFVFELFVKNFVYNGINRIVVISKVCGCYVYFMRYLVVFCL